MEPIYEGQVKTPSTLLYTCYNDAYWPLAQRTVPLMHQYALRHGYFFNVHTLPLVDGKDGIYWTKVPGAIEALKHYDRVFWLDADQMITNPEWKIPDTWGPGFHVSLDWGEDATEPWHFSVCGYVADKSTLPMFEAVLAMEPESRGQPFPEQNPMRKYVKEQILTENVDIKFTTHHRRVLNAVPETLCPGHVPEPWQKGDFVCHLTMLPLERRVELFDEIAKML